MIEGWSQIFLFKLLTSLSLNRVLDKLVSISLEQSGGDFIAAQAAVIAKFVLLGILFVSLHLIAI
jgi:hypothetical protein